MSIRDAPRSRTRDDSIRNSISEFGKSVSELEGQLASSDFDSSQTIASIVFDSFRRDVTAPRASLRNPFESLFTVSSLIKMPNVYPRLIRNIIIDEMIETITYIEFTIFSKARRGERHFILTIIEKRSRNRGTRAVPRITSDLRRSTAVLTFAVIALRQFHDAPSSALRYHYHFN